MIVGTRPEAIKLAPLAHALAAIGIAPRLLLTGQHPDLSAANHGLGGLPCDQLDCAGIADPIAHAALVAAAIEPILDRDLPDMVIVQGDTSSALGGARAAAKLDFALAHVEAGLRSHDETMPWPEEGNRIAIDALADLLFAPTKGAAVNLRSEEVTGEILVTGNTGIDALLALLGTLPPLKAQARRLDDPLDVLVTCHRRENWGAGIEAVAAALIELASERTARIEVILHPNPQVADAMRMLFVGEPGIALSPPTGHCAMIERMRRADLILSDSGGVQEEAPTLGVPLLILRERTERPEALAAGNARLVGTSNEQILSDVRRLHRDRAELAAMAQPSQPFGDGHAAPRIAGHIRRWLLHRDLRSSAA